MKKIKQLTLKILMEGHSPKQVAMAIAAGIMLGIFPIYGPITLLCLLLAGLTGLNAAIMVAGLYAMTFVKPLLIIPFLRLGEMLFRAEPMPISLAELSRRFAADAPGTLQEFGWSFAHAATGWLVTLPLALTVIYGLSLTMVLRWNSPRGVKAK